MNNDHEFLVWSNRFDDVEKYKDCLQEEYPNYTDEQLYETVYEELNMQMDAERDNLNIPTDGQILVIADLGLWDGRKPGYKILPRKNINACFDTCYDFTKWYVDKNGDFRCEDSHHDGTNYYLYREIKRGLSAKSVETLLSKIYNGTVTRADITRCTKRLGDKIAKVYGWNIPNRTRAVQPVR